MTITNKLDLTTKVSLVDYMGCDLTVCNAARVSFDNHSAYQGYDEHGIGLLADRDKGLIRYLAKHGHWTPFAHTALTFRIEAPMPIRTQFFKHKVGFVENEISRRYVKTEPSLYVPQWRYAPTDGAKQGSGDPVDDYFDVVALDDLYSQATSAALRAYERLLELGVAPEQARMVLPQGTMTEWYWTGSLAAYSRFYKQRIDPHAQWEIREYAMEIARKIPDCMQLSWQALTSE